MMATVGGLKTLFPYHNFALIDREGSHLSLELPSQRGKSTPSNHPVYRQP